MAAFVSDHVSADMVEATEFPAWADRYQVYGVPKTVFNDRTAVEGAQPEQVFLESLLSAVRSQPD